MREVREPVPLDGIVFQLAGGDAPRGEGSGTVLDRISLLLAHHSVQVRCWSRVLLVRALRLGQSGLKRSPLAAGRPTTCADIVRCAAPRNLSSPAAGGSSISPLRYRISQ
eukprot:scaffold3445_cov118-Isochrysis_galbana.AAC.3